MSARDSVRLHPIAVFLGLALVLLPQALDTYSPSSGPLTLLLLAGLHHASALLFGSAVVGRVAPSLRGLGERWLLGWTLGLGLFGHLFLVLAHAHLFAWWSASLVPVLGAAGAFLLRDEIAQLPAQLAEAVTGRWAAAWVGLATLVVALCLAPPTFYDACSYHVAIPEQWLAHGHAVITRHFVYSAIPLNAELSLSPLLLASGDPAAMNAGSGVSFVLLVLLAAAAGRRIAGAPGTTATVVATMPMAWFLAVGTKSDLHTSVHALALLLALAMVAEPLPDQRARERAWLVGAFAGLVLATKTTALAQLPFILLLIVVVPSWRRALGGARGVGLAVVVATVLGAPVYVQNAIVFGNPTFPALSSLFGGPPESSKVAGILAAWNTTVPLGEAWRLPWDLTFKVRSGTMNNLPGVLLLLCAPVAFFVRPLPPRLRAALLTAAVTVPAWLFTQSLLRYNPFVWLALALLAGWVLTRLLDGSRAARVVVTSTVVVVALANLHWSTLSHEVLLRGPSRWIAKGADREAFLRDALEPYAAHHFISRTLPRDALVLPMSDARLLYLRRRAILSELQARPVWDEPVREATDAADLLHRFRALGATHLLLHPPSVERALKIGWGPWDAATRARFDAFVTALGAPLFDEDSFAVYALPASFGPKAPSD